MSDIIKEGDLEYFCNCLLKNYKDHVTAIDKEGCCVYCGYHAVLRHAKAVDVRSETKWKDRIKKAKMEHLELLIKDRRHGEKCN